MAWSVALEGSCADVSARLKEYGDKLTGDARMEYGAVLPALQTLVWANDRLPGEYGPVGVRVEARGTDAESRQYHRSCDVSVEPVYDGPTGGGA